MKWTFFKFIPAPLVIGIAFFSLPVSAARGAVSLDVPSSVTVSLGNQTSIAADVSPTSEQERIGCACGGTCGEDVCTDPDAGCVCPGLDDKLTYYVVVSIVSDNPTIASAKYSNGSLTINGISAGKTTLHLVASLRKYSNSPTKDIIVTVAKAGSASTGNSSVAGSNGGTANGPAGSSTVPGNGSGGVSAVAVSPSTGGTVSKAGGSSAASSSSAGSAVVSTASASSTASTSSAASSAAAVESAVTSGSQDVTTVELDAGATGKTQLMDIQGQDKSVVFEKKDGDKLLYFWTFNGKNVNSPADIDMSLTTSPSSPIGNSLGVQGEALYLDFAHSGALPGKATVSVNVGDTYKDGDTIYAYYYDPASKKAELVENAVTVKDGFASFDITHCSTYFFTSSPLRTTATTAAANHSASASPVVPIVIVLAAVAALAFLYWFLWARKGGKPAELLEKITGRLFKKGIRS